MRWFFTISEKDATEKQETYSTDRTRAPVYKYVDVAGACSTLKGWGVRKSHVNVPPSTSPCPKHPTAEASANRMCTPTTDGIKSQQECAVNDVKNRVRSINATAQPLPFTLVWRATGAGHLRVRHAQGVLSSVPCTHGAISVTTVPQVQKNTRRYRSLQMSSHPSI